MIIEGALGGSERDRYMGSKHHLELCFIDMTVSDTKPGPGEKEGGGLLISYRSCWGLICEAGNS